MHVQFIAGDRGERVRMDYPPPFVDIASVKLSEADRCSYYALAPQPLNS